MLYQLSYLGTLGWALEQTNMQFTGKRSRQATLSPMSARLLLSLLA
jgi:hypothetical protein